MKKTIAVGIIALQHKGGLLSRFVGEAGVLPGTCIMVPQDCWAVLVAGDHATAVFDIGPHDLQLLQFNRQPSGLLYTVGKEPTRVEWYPRGSPYRRRLTMRVGNPMQFIEEMVVRRSAETMEAIVDALRPHFDAMIPPGQIQRAPEASKVAIAESLGHVGLMLVELVEESAVAPSVPVVAPPAPAIPAAPAPSPTVSVAPQTVALRFSQVWSSSTMDLFGKGELTLRIRLIGHPEPVFNPAGPFTYDATLEFLSPDDWLSERQWQELPAETMTFGGLQGDHYFRVFLVAEERDKGSSDALGTLEQELGQPGRGELELGPTQGGKRGQYVKLRARYE
ncbi:MAG: hypothetical protein ABI333_14685 [bacterium]